MVLSTSPVISGPRLHFSIVIKNLCWSFNSTPAFGSKFFFNLRSCVFTESSEETFHSVHIIKDQGRAAEQALGLKHISRTLQSDGPCFYLMGRCGCCCGITGLRHIAILKLVGTEPLHMGGVLELYPINGKKYPL